MKEYTLEEVISASPEKLLRIPAYSGQWLLDMVIPAVGYYTDDMGLETLVYKVNGYVITSGPSAIGRVPNGIDEYDRYMIELTLSSAFYCDADRRAWQKETVMAWLEQA